MHRLGEPLSASTSLNIPNRLEGGDDNGSKPCTRRVPSRSHLPRVHVGCIRGLLRILVITRGCYYRLSIIDWGGAAYADPAQDLGAAWALFDERTRPVFREAVGANEATWLRARAFELEQAVGGVLYYTPRGHSIGDVMARTLHRILEEA